MSNFKIQTIVFPKKLFTASTAEKWLKKHNYKTAGKRIKNWNEKNTLRYRQLPPSHFDKSTFKVKKLRNGVMMTFGKYIKKKKNTTKKKDKKK
tara:strand:- start:97 stop:375 length:279 start_codon:yes stop_codon:yes gene_type:complete